MAKCDKKKNVVGLAVGSAACARIGDMGAGVEEVAYQSWMRRGQAGDAGDGAQVA